MTSEKPFPYLYIIPAAFVGYCLVRFVALVHITVYSTNVISNELIIYSFLTLALTAFLFKYSLPTAIGRGIQFALLYFIYFLYTLFPSENVLIVYAQYRNIILSGFVVLFILAGLLIIAFGRGEFTREKLVSASSTKNMVTSYKISPTHVLFGLQLIIPQLVTGLLITIFSYAFARMLYDFSLVIERFL